MHSDEIFSEYYYPKQGESCTYQVKGVVHPEYGHVEHYVAYCSAANGCGCTYDVCPEPVELLGRCKAYAAYGKGKCSNEIYDVNEGDCCTPSDYFVYGVHLLYNVRFVYLRKYSASREENKIKSFVFCL